MINKSELVLLRDCLDKLAEGFSELPADLARNWIDNFDFDRSVLMKPEHVDWTARIVELLASCAA